ncbi:PLDc N-terminal domain-containing protein [uncultured Winogradskyella sp.]|jgi:hypothetical protein|uniref:PLDc N-terminal domain-containing protein n=1 Tax=uncultured Winogradskyella sp. TaxID=395353 RepID=UPI003516E1CC
MIVVDAGLVNFFIGCYILIILLLCIVVLRSQINRKDKVIWLVLLLCLPVFGVFFYLIASTFGATKVFSK